VFWKCPLRNWDLQLIEKWIVKFGCRREERMEKCRLRQTVRNTSPIFYFDSINSKARTFKPGV
jgi:hypothetical protein